MSNLENIAKLLDGRKYGKELWQDEEEQIKEAGIVVVFGASDDLVEFRGTIEDELGAYEGSVIYFDEEGTILNSAYLEKELKDMAKPNKLKTIEIIADYKDHPTFRYKTDIPHRNFEIMEDGEVYCVGICFYFKDLVG